MALSQTRQHKLMQAQRSFRIDSDSAKDVFHFGFLIKPVNKHGKMYKRDGDTNKWTLKEMGVQHTHLILTFHRKFTQS